MKSYTVRRAAFLLQDLPRHERTDETAFQPPQMGILEQATMDLGQHQKAPRAWLIGRVVTRCDFAEPEKTCHSLTVMQPYPIGFDGHEHACKRRSETPDFFADCCSSAERMRYLWTGISRLCGWHVPVRRADLSRRAVLHWPAGFPRLVVRDARWRLSQPPRLPRPPRPPRLSRPSRPSRQIGRQTSVAPRLHAMTLPPAGLGDEMYIA